MTYQVPDRAYKERRLGEIQYAIAEIRAVLRKARNYVERREREIDYLLAEARKLTLTD